MDTDPRERHQPSETDQVRPTLRQLLHSVLAAAFGVQTGKNRTRDFTHGNPLHFIVAGILFTLLFVVILLGAVQLIVHLAGL